MSQGLEITFDVLAKTKNEAATSVLIPALDSPDPAIQHKALTAILQRRSPVAHRVLLGRLHEMDNRWKEIVREKPGRMDAALRDAILSKDPQICTNGCLAIMWFRQYDLIPALVNAAEDQTNPNADLAARTVRELAELLYHELASRREYHTRRDPQLVRKQIVSSLEQSIQRFTHHKRREMVEAFLTIVNRDNATIKRILQDPRDGCYLTLVDILSHSERMGVMRLALSYLDDPHAPSAAMGILSRRGDLVFLKYLLGKIGYEPSKAAAKNLRRIEAFPWLCEDMAVLDRLDNAAQHSLVQMIVTSGMKRLEVFRTLEYLLANGNVGGRRAASMALAEFNGSEACELTLRALEDQDPQVQANGLSQLRQRGIPGGMARLIQGVESPHEVVRDAARSGLVEFSFERFLNSFELLEEEVRDSTALLVKKIDPKAMVGLIEEMHAKARSRRLRGIAIAQAMDAVSEVENELIELIQDEDHMIRCESARALGYSITPAAQNALRQALEDRSLSVREAAAESLRQWSSRSEPRSNDSKESLS